MINCIILIRFAMQILNYLNCHLAVDYLLHNRVNMDEMAVSKMNKGM